MWFLRPLPLGALVILAAVAGLSIGSEDANPANGQQVIAELAEWQPLVGAWQGTGQPRRGSAKGIWREQADVRWNLQAKSPNLEMTVGGSPHWTRLQFRAGTREFPLEITTFDAEETARIYRGVKSEGRWILESLGAEGLNSSRLTVTWQNPDRWLLQLERRATPETAWQRLGEIAYQRAGTKLQASKSTGPECIVTGGLGTIPVTHEGRTYYVCCTGCRDAFQDDPAEFVKLAAERRAKMATQRP